MQDVIIKRKSIKIAKFKVSYFLHLNKFIELRSF